MCVGVACLDAWYSFSNTAECWACYKHISEKNRNFKMVKKKWFAVSANLSVYHLLPPKQWKQEVFGEYKSRIQSLRTLRFILQYFFNYYIFSLYDGKQPERWRWIKCAVKILNGVQGILKLSSLLGDHLI